MVLLNNYDIQNNGVMDFIYVYGYSIFLFYFLFISFYILFKIIGYWIIF